MQIGPANDHQPRFPQSFSTPGPISSHYARLFPFKYYRLFRSILVRKKIEDVETSFASPRSAVGWNLRRAPARRSSDSSLSGKIQDVETSFASLPSRTQDLRQDPRSITAFPSRTQGLRQDLRQGISTYGKIHCPHLCVVDVLVRHDHILIFSVRLPVRPCLENGFVCSYSGTHFFTAFLVTQCPRWI